MANMISSREKLIVTLLRLLMAVRIHDSNNQSLIECAESFLSVLKENTTKTAWLSIKNSDERIFINDERLVYSREYSGIITSIIQYFDKRRIGELLITGSSDINLQSVLIFAKILNNAERAENPVEWIIKLLLKEKLSWVEISEVPEKKGNNFTNPLVAANSLSNNGQRELKKEKGQRMYARAIASLSGVAKSMRGQRITGIRKAQRLIQNMVDYITDDESVLMGMSTIREYDDYTYYHSVNVSIIAMSMGLHMRLPRDLVETLGICGLFHDLGKVDIPIEIITKQGKLSDSERDTIEKHSIYSVNKILRLNASRELKHKILIAPLEHHMKYDLSGYPQMQSKKKVSFIGRILAIADVFDALTSPRSYRKIAFSPDRALAIMLQQSGRDFDPILLKIFINMLGVYPVGTLLKFDTGELGLVCGRKKGTTGVRPDVVIIDKDDSGYKKGEKVSLDQCDAVSGEYRRNIIKSYHPSQFGIQAARYI